MTCEGGRETLFEQTLESHRRGDGVSSLGIDGRRRRRRVVRLVWEVRSGQGEEDVFSLEGGFCRRTMRESEGVVSSIPDGRDPGDGGLVVGTIQLDLEDLDHLPSLPSLS